MSLAYVYTRNYRHDQDNELVLQKIPSAHLYLAFLFACCPSVSRQPLVCFLSLFITLNCLKFYTNEIVQGAFFIWWDDTVIHIA